MSASTDMILTELLERAAAEPFGLYIRSTNAKQHQIQFANLQRAMGSRRNHNLIAALPAEPDVVFLIKRSVELS